MCAGIELTLSNIHAAVMLLPGVKMLLSYIAALLGERRSRLRHGTCFFCLPHVQHAAAHKPDARESGCS